MVTGLVSPLLAPQIGEHAGWRWRGGQATIPVLLAQTDQTFTMILYHADAPSYLRTRAKHLFISRLRSEGVDLSFSQTIGPYQVDDLRDLPLIERKRRLAKLIGRAKRRPSGSLNI